MVQCAAGVGLCFATGALALPTWTSRPASRAAVVLLDLPGLPHLARLSRLARPGYLTFAVATDAARRQSLHAAGSPRHRRGRRRDRSWYGGPAPQRDRGDRRHDGDGDDARDPRPCRRQSRRRLLAGRRHRAWSPPRCCCIPRRGVSPASTASQPPRRSGPLASASLLDGGHRATQPSPRRRAAVVGGHDRRHRGPPRHRRHGRG